MPGRWGTGCVDLPLGLSLRPKRSALRAPQGEATAAAETEGKTPRTQAKSKNRRDHKKGRTEKRHYEESTT